MKVDHNNNIHMVIYSTCVVPNKTVLLRFYRQLDTLMCHKNCHMHVSDLSATSPRCRDDNCPFIGAVTSVSEFNLSYFKIT